MPETKENMLRNGRKLESYFLHRIVMIMTTIAMMMMMMASKRIEPWAITFSLRYIIFAHKNSSLGLVERKGS